MRFPPGTTLPSASELKAKFSRFGPIDTSSIRISWVKSRCTLVFIKKSDAEEAYAHAVKNKKLFGQIKVTYRLQPEIYTSNLSLGDNRPQEETLVNPIICQYQEIYAKYREEAVDRTHVDVGHRNIDISKMLHLLNECSRIVREFA
ncbi:hypothetical protein L1987_72383 [Smallanthus sonchifolius]|uniref:Uncharacterized protein n=1 Tax=Smallanthus sonchifolius TaxID=185202 RepID=A0ACB9AU83_9ASTR|nr:hypothetical protein L1987_72383 [Smallanthus sonchifolius]